MVRKFFVHLRQQWMGALALFFVLTGGTAYALDGSNTVFSDDIVNTEVKRADIGQGAVATDEIANTEVKIADIGQGAVASDEIKNDSILPGDVALNSLTSPRIADASLTGIDIANNSLKGADIDESTLDVGNAARAYAYVPSNGCTGTPGTCTVLQSKGISTVTRDGEGVYCVTAPGIDSNQTPAAVTVDWQTTDLPEGNASAMTAELGCGPGNQAFSVVTERQSQLAVNSGDGTNNVVVSGLAQNADDVGFTIVIP